MPAIRPVPRQLGAVSKSRIGELELQHFITPAIYRNLVKLGEAARQGRPPETLAPKRAEAAARISVVCFE